MMIMMVIVMMMLVMIMVVMVMMIMITMNRVQIGSQPPRHDLGRCWQLPHPDQKNFKPSDKDNPVMLSQVFWDAVIVSQRDIHL